jgi:hypothetical protein
MTETTPMRRRVILAGALVALALAAILGARRMRASAELRPRVSPYLAVARRQAQAAQAGPAGHAPAVPPWMSRTPRATSRAAPQ